MTFNDDMFSKQLIISAYDQFIQNPAEFDEEELFQVFDANYAFPIFADFINNHTHVINAEENSAVVSLKFAYDGDTFFAKMYTKNPRVILVTIVTTRHYKYSANKKPKYFFHNLQYLNV